jgi:hypothetical protein
MFAALPFYFYNTILPNSPYTGIIDLTVVAIYCYGVSICFTLSATFHVLCNHSCSFALYWNKLDYLGILVLMWGAGIPTIYYGFLCNPNLQRIYWSMVSRLQANGKCQQHKLTSIQDHNHRPRVHLHDPPSTLCFAGISPLARLLLCRIRLQLHYLRSPWAAAVWLGGSASAHVVSLHGLDGDGERHGSINICSKGESNILASVDHEY